MSDTPDTEEPSPSTSTDDSKRPFRLDRTFGDVGNPISDSDAVRILSRRLKGSATTQRMSNQRNDEGDTADIILGTYEGRTEELARKLLAEFPEDMRTEVVLKNADIRPILQQVAWKPKGEEVLGLTTDETLLAGHVLLDETDRIRKEAEKAMLPLVAPGDVEAGITAQNTIDHIVNGYRTGNIIRVDTTLADSGTGTLATNPETGEVVGTGGAATAAGNAGFDVSGLDDISDPNAVEFISRDEIQHLARETTDPSDTLTYLFGEDAEARQGKILPGEPQYEVLYDDKVHKEWQNNGRQGSNAPVKGTRMTATEAAAAPSTMSRAQVHALGKKLKDAGLMTEDMVDPTDYSDPSFKKAWQNLMYKSIERGESMTSILDAQVKAHRDAIEDAYAPLLTDPARIRMNADALAGNILGRRATDDEHAQLVEFMHGLERRNQKIQAGFDPDAVGTLDELKGEAVQADLEARMQDWIKEKNPTEAAAHDVDDSYDKLTQLMGGPGGPGLVR